METATYDPYSRQSQAIAEVRYNARTLLRDAQLLLAARRWGTAISLSILACEESAKCLAFNYMLGAGLVSSGRLTWDSAQHEAFLDYLRSCLKVGALDEYFLELGETDKHQRLISGLKFLDRLCGIDGSSRPPHDPEVIFVCNEIERRIRYDRAYQIAEDATTGRLESIKQRGFHIELRARRLLSPQNFSETDARLYVRAAEIVVEVVAPERIFGEEPVALAPVDAPYEPAFDEDL
jgi:AbiV